MGHDLIRAGKYISNSPDCTDELAAALELLAQMTNMHIEKTIVRCGIALEESPGDLVARDDAAGGAHKHFEEIELKRGELDGRAGGPGLASGGVELDVADYNHFGCVPVGGIGATQDGADAREEFVGVEGLGKIVVGSGVEAHDAIVLLHTRGQHDDGKVLSAAQLLQQGEAVKDGQHDVENREIVGSVERSIEAVAAVVGTVQMVAVLGEEFPHHAAQLDVVIDEQEG